MTQTEYHPDFPKEQSILKEIWQECKFNLMSTSKEKERKQLEKELAQTNDKEGYGALPPLIKNINRLQGKIESLHRLLENPYFGKIVIDDSNSKATYYIGKQGYQCAKGFIINWKAPLANIYYSKKGSYTPLGKKEITVNLKLVRTLDIENDTLLDLYDDYIRGVKKEFQDPFLLKQLGRSGKQRLKDVVITIQEEQNEIIRAPNQKHLIIQGSAGTGKSIALLYRVAYLMYINEWSYDDVLFISPSKVFLNFVSSMLHDVDMHLLPQLTIKDLIPQNIERKLRNAKAFPPILEIDRNKRQVASDAADFKGTSAFKQLIDEKIDEIVVTFARKINDFNYKSIDIAKKIPALTIRNWFIKDYSRLPLEVRKKKIRERLKTVLEDLLESSLDGRKGVRIYSPQETEKTLGQYFKEWPDFKNIYNNEALQWYINLLNNTGQVGEALENAQTHISQNVSDWNKYFSCTSLNDWAALFYMHQRIVGEFQNTYKLIVIDEAQLLSPLWFAGLNFLLEEGGTINLTGDLNQKPAMIDRYDWSELEEVIGPVEVRELSKSYRLTDEIAKYALDILFLHPSPYQFETVGRIGEQVLTLDGREEERLNNAVEIVMKLLGKHETVAIVGRTGNHCEKIFSTIKISLERCTLVNDNGEMLNQIVIIPVHLIGGLEFDVVVIADHMQYDLNDIFEAQQLYLAVTRAVHKLILA